ncbi:hypothetical protein ACLBOM_31460 [Escherichia coli]
MRTIASNQKASRPPGPFLRCTNWSSSCVTDCLPPVNGKIAAIFRFQQARRDAAYSRRKNYRMLSPYLQEVAKRRTFAIISTPIIKPKLKLFYSFKILSVN